MGNHTANQPVVLVTGGAKRIGAAICRQFHDSGFRVIIHYGNSSEAATSLADEFNLGRKNSATVVQADLTDQATVKQMADNAMSAFGQLDVLVNNASSFYATPFFDVTQDQWEELAGSNLSGAFFLAQELGKELQRTQGAIVNITDIYASKALKNYAPYVIAKSGLKSMTRALALELAPTVRVNSVAPGAIIWPSPENSSQLEQMQEQILASIPIGRTGEVEEIAATVFFLASEAASYITGATIRVDGGRSLNL